MPLQNRVGAVIGNDELHTRLSFLDWSLADTRQLQALPEHLKDEADVFVDELYRRLVRYPEVATILGNQSTVQRLKQSQRGYYKRLFAGEIDSKYVEERWRIGQVHERVGVDLKWYLGGYRLFLASMLQAFSAHKPANAADDQSRWAAYQSLLKVVFFDIALAAEAYVGAQHAALRASKQRYAHAMRGANDGLWDWNLDQDSLYVSERWAQMLGLDLNDVGLRMQDWQARIHPDDLFAFRSTLKTHIEGEAEFFVHEYRIRHRDGRYLWVLTRGVLEVSASGTRRMAGSQTDISNQRHIQAQLEYAALHDPLTGLINRNQLDNVARQVSRELARPGSRAAALLFIDLDRFKLINDSLGHAVGDSVLVQVARRLQRCLRTGDALARFGGDEFVMVLRDLADMSDAEMVAQRVLIALKEPLCCGEHTLVVNASIGLASIEPEQSFDEAMRAADIALYQAKAAGKGRVQHFNEAMLDQAHERMQLESSVLQALQRNEFDIYYQPVHRLPLADKAKPVGVEALLRWRQGNRMISPAAFIPVLEESGEIVAVGYWVLQQACRQVRHWQQSGAEELKCSVNLSGLQLEQQDFAQQVQRVLTDTGLSPASLVLEITESLLIDQSGSTLANLRELAQLGVRIALDDFGTGFCSLGYLNRFPLHVLKLDRSFLNQADQCSKQRAICRAIIQLARTLEMDVIAEGVETREQVDFLHQERCYLGQGFLLGYPMPAAEFQQHFEQTLSTSIPASSHMSALPVGEES
ncbi:EAL domain-containing protein [Halopseudomonas salegens]|uniref:Diguanylate cyclase DosC n=1 Tax=Halopseudomonas salegens TaxID=1434072 RepID=A0A1H2DZE6_9GAMM|nr:EAL domain-containing protein [Halopseudomonas salegens]SDT88206.1 PAS domain S-box-containing protein/diguanylate cyclase (GGDEF) domain-containing protein [Halopseudomonas salegens]